METTSLVNLLRRRCAKSTPAAVARELGLSESTLSLILRGKRQPGPKVARALGFDAVRVFR